MRGLGAVRIVATLGASFGLASVGFIAGAPSALADGGAYIDLDRTHYLPGQTAFARTYVTVPRPKQELLERGPFSAFLVTGAAWPQEGRPLPDDVIPLGTFSIEPDHGATFELTARLSIPDVPGDFYPIAVCNEPCTVAGFREPISGYVSIVQTEREAALLDARQRLGARLSRARRDLRKTEQELEAVRTEFEARERDRAYLAGEVNRLNQALDRARAASATPALMRGLATAVAVLLVVAAVVLLRRRRTHPLALGARSRDALPSGGPTSGSKGDGAERQPSVSSAAHGPSVDVPADPGPADRRRGVRVGERLDPVRP
jgi:hypothetical protein